MSLPVTRPAGRALVVAHPTGRAQPVEAMNAVGFDCAPVDDPYGAMVELARRPLVYRALVLGLAGMYREELELIRSVKRRYPHVEIWLTQTDGRQSALAEAMRLGADGLLAEDGLHRTAMGGDSNEPSGTQRPATGLSSAAPSLSISGHGNSARLELDFELDGCEPVLSADELKALLQEQPSFPPDSGEG